MKIGFGLPMPVLGSWIALLAIPTTTPIRASNPIPRHKGCNRMALSDGLHIAALGNVLAANPNIAFRHRQTMFGDFTASSAHVVATT